MKFEAPWATSLKFVTSFTVSILLVVSFVGLFLAGILPAFLPLVVLFVSAFYMIRGYELSARKLIIHRLGWMTEIDLHDLQSAEVDPEAMKRSLRMFGNGGLFCFAGHFRNKKLGAYRVFATDPKRAVVLRFSDRIIVVTPDRPEEFAAQLTG